MNCRDELVTFESFETEIRKLENLLVELGVHAPGGSDLADLTWRGFRVLYYSLFANERPQMTPEQAIAEGAVLAGLGDLAAKINRAHGRTGFEALRPHLANMVKGGVRMNHVSSVTDEAANKNSELYVGCLALGAGMVVELEDPIESGNGKNPDVLLKRAEHEWAIAVKASHSSKSPTIFGNIAKGVEQIERSGRDGLVFVNLKNVVDHVGLAKSSPFENPDIATKAATAQVKDIVDRLQAEIVQQDWIDLFAGKRARPIVAFMAQITVSAIVARRGEVFVPVKVMLARPFPPAPASGRDLAGTDAEALALLTDLNEQLQRNLSS